MHGALTTIINQVITVHCAITLYVKSIGSIFERTNENTQYFVHVSQHTELTLLLFYAYTESEMAHL